MPITSADVSPSIFDLEYSVIPSGYADRLTRTLWKLQAPPQPYPSTDLGQHLQAFASLSERASFQGYLEIANSRNRMVEAGWFGIPDCQNLSELQHIQGTYPRNPQA